MAKFHPSNSKQRQYQRFKERAKEAFPDRRVITYLHYSEDGENIFWASHRWNSETEHFHADKNCPYLPGGDLKAYPESWGYRNAERWHFPDPCSYCTRLNDE